MTGIYFRIVLWRCCYFVDMNGF